MSAIAPEHFAWSLEDGVGVVTLTGAERKNPLTFASYAELRDTFRALAYADDVARGRDHRRGGQLLLRRRRARHHRPADRDGHARAAALHADDRRPREGDARLPAADRRRRRRRLRRRGRDDRDGLRPAARRRRAAKVAFLFTRVGLAGCDMGACALLPRIIGQGRAAELLFTGRSMGGRGGRALGLLQPRSSTRTSCWPRRTALAASLASGPTFAHAMTKTMLDQEWDMSVRRGDRGRGAGAGDLHADRATSSARTARSWPSERPVFEGD